MSKRRDIASSWPGRLRRDWGGGRQAPAHAFTGPDALTSTDGGSLA